MDKFMENVMCIKPGTPEMESLLQAGYPFSLEEAKRLVEERRVNPASVSYERARDADAMLQAYKAKPIAISKRPGWHRNVEVR